ncbi:phage tail protein [Paraburkholderia sp. MM5477-R1]|uniref:phage tail protein n=1 Tax=Paraburkholderia sp. MM5477-R1 TaxID=2991062 RepID=UPI003D1B0282
MPDLSQLFGFDPERTDPLLGFNFQVSISDSQPAASSALAGISVSLTGAQATAGFSEISGLEASMDVENYDAGGVNGGTLRFPGRVKWSNLVFKRGMVAQRPISDTSDVWTWLQQFLDGQCVRKDGVITLMDESGAPALAWSWRRGLPIKWTGASLNAQQSQVAIEQLEIAHEGLTMVTGGSLGIAIVGAAAALGSLL